jgi:hypothetical protein
LLRRRNAAATLVALGIAVAGVAGAADADGDAATFRPAAFGDSGRSLLALLACPRVPDVPVDLTVLCKAFINANGSVRAKQSGCLVTDRDLVAYRRITENALAKAEFVPAVVDGEAVPVLMTFRVRIRQAGTTCDLAAIPNPGMDPAMQDANYVAPQRIMRPDRSSAGYRPPRLEFHSLVQTRNPVLFVSSVEVSTAGVPSDSRLDFRNDAWRFSEEAAVRQLDGAVFIPGLRDGRPATMRYFQVLWISSGFW